MCDVIKPLAEVYPHLSPHGSCDRLQPDPDLDKWKKMDKYIILKRLFFNIFFNLILNFVNYRVAIYIWKQTLVFILFLAKFFMGNVLL